MALASAAPSRRPSAPRARPPSTASARAPPSSAPAAAAAAPPAVPRRAALGAAGAALLLAVAAPAPPPAGAAYGDAARVFGAGPTNPSRFMPYTGDGYALVVPSAYNPSKERDQAGVQMRWEDNFDPATTLTVLAYPTDKGSITDYGSHEEFAEQHIRPLLGKQSWTGETASEGGFPPGRVAVANLLDAGTRSTNGKPVYSFDIVTRTADGALGGRHHLFSAGVSNGRLYILAQKVGEKRWLRGTDKVAKAVDASFTLV